MDRTYFGRIADTALGWHFLVLPTVVCLHRGLHGIQYMALGGLSPCPLSSPTPQECNLALLSGGLGPITRMVVSKYGVGAGNLASM